MLPRNIGCRNPPRLKYRKLHARPKLPSIPFWQGYSLSVFVVFMFYRSHIRIPLIKCKQPLYHQEILAFSVAYWSLSGRSVFIISVRGNFSQILSATYHQESTYKSLHQNHSKRLPFKPCWEETYGCCVYWCVAPFLMPFDPGIRMVDIEQNPFLFLKW